MRTTINKLVGRRGDAHSEEELDDVLNHARKILADTCVLLDHEVDTQFATEIDGRDEERLKKIKGLIVSTQKAIQQILDIEAKLRLSQAVDGRELNVEEAREEIMRRIARISV